MFFQKTLVPIFYSTKKITYEIYLTNSKQGICIDEILEPLLRNLREIDCFYDDIYITSEESLCYGDELLSLVTILDYKFPDKYIYIQTKFNEKYIKEHFQPFMCHVDYFKITKEDFDKCFVKGGRPEYDKN